MLNTIGLILFQELKPYLQGRPKHQGNETLGNTKWWGPWKETVFHNKA